MQKKPNYYEFFGLKTYEDDQLLIKSAYRRMMLKWHPDRHVDPKDKPHAEHMAKQVNEVYRILSTHKDEYDNHIGRRHTSKSNDGTIDPNNVYEEFFNSSQWGFQGATSNTGNSHNPFGKGNFREDLNEWAKVFQEADRAQREAYHAKRNKKISESPLYEQKEAFEIINQLTWDEWTNLKKIIEINGYGPYRKTKT